MRLGTKYMIQITYAIKLIRREIPSGHSVEFWIDQTTLDGENFGSLVTETGIKMIAMARPIILKVEP